MLSQKPTSGCESWEMAGVKKEKKKSWKLEAKKKKKERESECSKIVHGKARMM